MTAHSIHVSQLRAFSKLQGPPGPIAQIREVLLYPTAQCLSNATFLPGIGQLAL